MEWPRSCTYWALLRVRKQIKRNNMVFSDFDGCQFGLKAVEPSTEFYLRKPWRFASNIPEISPEFNGLYCPGETHNHQHAQTRGLNAFYSQYYTPYMTMVIHIAIYRHVLDGCKRNTCALQSIRSLSKITVPTTAACAQYKSGATQTTPSLPRPTMSGVHSRWGAIRKRDDAEGEESGGVA